MRNLRKTQIRASDGSMPRSSECVASFCCGANRPMMAEAAFTRAVEIAQHQQTRTFELRAALALARLYQATDRSEAGRLLLRPVAARFKDEPELPEVAEAYRLLGATC